MKIRVSLTTGQQIDFDAPEDFNFVGWVISVRESGRWLVDNIYVPAKHIVSVLRIDEAGKPVMGTIQ